MNFLSKVIRRLIDFKVHSEISPNDIVLCEFPKSGVTYFSFLISNYLACYENKSIQINFFNLNRFVQDLHRTPSVDKAIEFKSAGFRVLKSHSLYSCLRYPQKIVLIRNPFKTLQSYHRHITASSALPVPNFDVFIRSRKFGVNAWLQYYIKHLSDANPLGQALFCFEDNVTNPLGTLEKFCRLTGIVFCEDSAYMACQKTQLSEMISNEECTSRHGCKERKSRFVGSAQLNANQYSINSNEYILKKFSSSILPDLLAPEILDKIYPKYS